MPVDSGEGKPQLTCLLQETSEGMEVGEEQAFARSSLTGRSPTTASGTASDDHLMTEEHLDEVHRSVQFSWMSPLRRKGLSWKCLHSVRTLSTGWRPAR